MFGRIAAQSAGSNRVCKKKVVDAAAAAGRIAGHWGEDAVGFRWTEQDSVDNRFQQMDTGPFFSGTIFTPPSGSRPLAHTAKGLCIRIGEKNEAAVCFDTELLRVSAGWTGPFLDIDPARYGIIAPTKIAGEVQFTTPAIPGWAQGASFDDTRVFKPYGPLPRNHARYRGLYLHGNRVVLTYSVGATEVLESPWFDLIDGVPIVTRTLQVGPSREAVELLICGADGIGEIAAATPGVTKHRSAAGDTTIQIAPRDSTLQLTVAIAARAKVDGQRLAELTPGIMPPAALAPWTQPGRARWTAEITTRGELGEPRDGPFAIDTLTLPFDNPHRALFFVSGHDFFTNGVAAICTLHGDVWLVSGIDNRLARLRWKRFATGLFQPLGLKIVRDTVYVVGRDQITRLHDRDGNGEADWYENFNNDGHVTTNGHEYVMCLETDSRGNFYYLKGDSGGKTQHDGCLLRVSPDGSQLDVFATGFRNANGMAISPHDEITVAPQEGEWTPASGIFTVVQGGFHGGMSVHHQATPPTDYVRPICWLSRRIDNSSGGQVWIPADNWGPLGGKMLHLSYGQCSAMLVLNEVVAGQQQGGVVPLPFTFRSGAMRGRFRPNDGHLYVSGLHGWVSNAADDGCLQRVRYVAQAAALPIQVATRSNGLLVTFSEPLDRVSAEDPDNYRAEQWNYRWSAQYGSPELRPSQPNVEGRDRVWIESATLLGSGNTVFLEIPNLQPVSVLELACQVTTAAGKAYSRRLSYTIHHVPEIALPASQLTGRRPLKYLTEAQRKSLKPGLLFRFAQGTDPAVSHEVVRRRMATLLVAANEAPATFLQPGPFRVVMEGFLRTTEPGKYRLRTSGTGSARTFLKGELIGEFGTNPVPDSKQSLENREHDLRGYVPLRVEYASNAGEELAECRLFWHREEGSEEPIPPAAFYCLGDDPAYLVSEQRRRVAETVINFRCAKCHPFGPHGAPSMLDPVTVDGPSLKSAGDRLNPEWVAAWLVSPAALKNDARMPAMLNGTLAEYDRETWQKAAHLAAFVTSLRAAVVSDRTPRDLGEPASDIKLGGQLWEQLGCIGCHRLTPVAALDEFDRISLQFVARKFRDEALRQFLLRPHADYAATRMPDFHLKVEEARALSAFLIDQYRPTFLDELKFPAGDKREGQRLAVELRCHACHELGATVVREGLAASRKRLGMDGRFAAGCLSPLPAKDGLAPRFGFAAPQREELRATLAAAGVATWRSCAADESQRLLESLRCNACHNRDEHSSQLPAVLSEDGRLGWLPESLPNLTWAGERLQVTWMERFIGGQIADRPRPHLTARMPAFPAYAKVLSQGFAAQHGIRDEPSRGSPPSAVEPELASGYRLTLKEGGLDCRQCHAVGSQPAQGDDKTRLAPGINFAQVPDRLRYDFYRRFVLDPPRYDVNTRMPKLSADGRTTNVQHHYQGDARRQFDAIWAYLQTIHGTEP